MNQIARLLSGNQGDAAAGANVADRRPGQHLAIVTCMDARIDVFAVLGVHLGEALVIRNAGGRVTIYVLRSLALSCHVLGVDTVVVMQHTKCIDDHAAGLREDIELLVAKPYLAPAHQHRRLRVPRRKRRDRPHPVVGRG